MRILFFLSFFITLSLFANSGDTTQEKSLDHYIKYAEASSKSATGAMVVFLWTACWNMDKFSNYFDEAGGEDKTFPKEFQYMDIIGK